jgi:hypothetical protein
MASAKAAFLVDRSLRRHPAPGQTVHRASDDHGIIYQNPDPTDVEPTVGRGTTAVQQKAVVRPECRHKMAAGNGGPAIWLQNERAVPHHLTTHHLTTWSEA